MAVAEGLLSKEEAEALRAEALHLGRPPLELLVERGRLSTESLASLRRESQEESQDTRKPANDTVTVKRPSREVPAVEVTDFPVPGWERYQPMRLLGQGGMGRVFLAHDPRLRRDVALKFVRDDDPDSARRFVFEARAQARVVHERVCQVYEVGEIQGKTYIAMQYIDGLPLNQLARQITAEQKALVLRDAAEGVHAAHRAGLIHRDLKPSNIRVERAEDGSLKPYVVDFGLARDWKEGMTASGSVLGTPHYMAPEQARGEVTRLDRRADVYSLGATLYNLLTGSYPVHGSNHLEVLSNIPTVEPRPPRALDKDIPVDLEAIVLKCLEKERSARYDSARALAEDLDRFLNGEPVRARPAGLWYRLRKKARRHRAAVTMGSVALVLVTLALGQALLARREASQRERQASRFTAKVKDIENHALQSHLSPPHDTRPDRETIRAWMRELEDWMREAGEPGQGPGHYALGQGFLALGDKAKAREHLETAWARGYHESHVAYALALVLGQLYQEQLLEVERQYQQRRGQTLEPGTPPPEQWREARRRDLELRFRDPVLKMLRKVESKEAPVPPDYVEALLAFYEGRLDEALKRLDALGNGPPWFYETPRLRGDIFLALATRHWDQGENKQARAAFDDSRRAYERAADIGRSDPAVHHAMAQLELAVLEMEISSSGDEVEPAYERGLQAVSRALEVEPDHHEARLLEVRFHRRLAGERDNRGGNWREPLERALAAARAVKERAPEWPKARLELGALHWQWGQSRYTHREDPREQLDAAVKSLEGLAPEDQDPDVYLLLGRIYKTWAQYEAQNHQDSRPRVSKAIESYRMALQMNENQIPARAGLASMYLMRALLPSNPDPGGDLRQASKTLEEARALNPHFAVLYFYEARAHGHMAARNRARDGDARPELQQALSLYRQGITINRKLPYLYYNAGTILTELAREEWERGGDPSPLFGQAQELFDQAIPVEPKNPFTYHNLGEMLALRAEYLGARGEKPGPSVLAAERALMQAIKQDSKNPRALASLGWVHHTQAMFELDHGRNPDKSLARAQAALEQAHTLGPGDDYSWWQLGKVRELQARWKARRGQARTEDFEHAEQAFLKALALAQAPQDQELRLSFGRFYWEWASWKEELGQAPEPPLTRGLKWADELLKERPHWQQAQVLSACLRLLKKDSASPEQRRQALEELTRTLADNPNLARKWERQFLRVRKLVDPSQHK
ncbi:protein kinase domain-containing protein [Archangium sp.]|uniref:protein kinase domain-containing protein n=1 Tax=Archangium sp. TaxID=1872627 RepID=UPI002D77BA98|nr:protein kinase [Archangium sp.]